MSKTEILLRDGYTRARLIDALKAMEENESKLEDRIAELERDNEAEMQANADLCARLMALEAERDAALREVAELRDSLFERILSYLGIDPGDECKRCSGVGRATYGSTATWRGGVGGQVLTVDVCNRCWGSGSASRPWKRAAIDAARAREKAGE